MAQEFEFFLPTKGACEDYGIPRFPKNYKELGERAKAQNILSGITDLFNNPDPPSRRFLDGPQFNNKPGNLLQSAGAAFSFGYYAGDPSQFVISKENLHGPTDAFTDASQEKLMNSFTLEILSNQPYQIKNSTASTNGPFNTQVMKTEYSYGSGSANQPKILGYIHIAPNNDINEGFGFDHQHSYGQPQDIMTTVLSPVIGFIGGAAQVVNQASNIVKSGFGGLVETKGNNNQNFEAQPLIKIDIAETYQSTNKMEITIPFTLFTKRNFTRDILTPIAALNAISYPKRKGGIEKLVAEMLTNVSNAINSINTDPNSLAAPALTATSDKAKYWAEKLTNNKDFFNSLSPGFRVIAAEPPSYINVSHSTNLINPMRNCVVTNFSYKFKGPWINTEDKRVKAGETRDNSQVKFWEFWKARKDILDADFIDAGIAFPLRAECSITLKMLDPMFADDFLLHYASIQDQYYNSKSKDKKSVVRNGLVSVKSTPTPTVLNTDAYGLGVGNVP